MESTLISFVHQLGTLEFWQTLLDGFGDLGPCLLYTSDAADE